MFLRTTGSRLKTFQAIGLMFISLLGVSCNAQNNNPMNKKSPAVSNEMENGIPTDVARLIELIRREFLNDISCIDFYRLEDASKSSIFGWRARIGLPEHPIVWESAKRIVPGPFSRYLLQASAAQDEGRKYRGISIGFAGGQDTPGEELISYAKLLELLGKPTSLKANTASIAPPPPGLPDTLYANSGSHVRENLEWRDVGHSTLFRAGTGFGSQVEYVILLKKVDQKCQ